MTSVSTKVSAFYTGKITGKYSLLELIGRGGMAEVYRSFHPDLGRNLAIKIIHPHLTSEPDFVERFRREAQAAASLRHPHIVQVYDFAVTDEGLSYMVMEYVAGTSLDNYLKQNAPLSFAQALPLFQQVAEAVGYAHQRGIIHRDIKPGNILLDEEGKVYLTDFGLAQIIGANRLTQTGSTSGTPAYMAPEQVMGQTVTPAADIYALGVLLYEMLTGRRPYEGETAAAIMVRQATEEPILPSQLNPQFDPYLESVILKALAKNPMQRFADVPAFLSALQQPHTIQPAIPLATFPTVPKLELSKPAHPPESPLPSSSPIPQQLGRVVVLGVVILSLLLGGLALVRGLPRLNKIGLVAGTPTPLLAQNSPSSATPTHNNQPATPDQLLTLTAAPEIPGMVFVPGGSFKQGDDAGNPNEAPAHLVELSPYYIDRTEVTNAAYAEFVQATNYPAPAHWRTANPSIWELVASEPYLIGDLEDRFSFDGTLVMSGTGSLTMSVNADADAGTLIATYIGAIQITPNQTLTGTFRIEQHTFHGLIRFQENGIGDFVHMHGLSGNETPLYPEITAKISTWGFANLYYNDQLLREDLGIHVMYGDGVRTAQHFIPRASGQCCFSEQRPADSLTDPNHPQITVWLFDSGLDYSVQQEFWIDLYYDQITELVTPNFINNSSYPQGLENHPVTFVSWQDATNYCQWRNAQLPTESQWEFAARGPQNFLYPWGNDRTATEANVNNLYDTTVPVGSFPLSNSPFGLADMTGNVWEWVADGYDANYYQSSELHDPLGPRNAEENIVRGASFHPYDLLGRDETRTTYRRPLPGESVLDNVGFRCLLPLASNP